MATPKPAALPTSAGPVPHQVSPWAPLRHRVFAAMWLAQFVSNVGSWMQTVGAQWLILALTGSATYAALVQTASSLPVVLFALVAGALGDLVDRRLLLIVTQVVMLAAAGALGILTVTHRVSPWSILALVFALGVGQAITSPTWQTLQPELVDPSERTQAISLGSVNQNLARAIGPAVGGLLLAAIGTGSVFFLNAASFLAVVAVLLWWRPTRRPPSTLPREHLGEALRAGVRYVRASPVLKLILARAFAFILFATAIWALLPAVAADLLHLGSAGYGLLLGFVGVGAVLGGVLLPELRSRLSPDALLAGASLALAGVAGVTGVVRVTGLVAVAMVVGGAMWVLALSTMNSLYQLSLPPWAKARGMGFYLMAFQGGGAVGAAVLGVVAGRAGLSTALLVAAAGLVASAALGLRFHFQPIDPEELLPAGDWPAPNLDPSLARGGPVLVTLRYQARPGHAGDLVAALERTKLSRQRTGASRWQVWQDSADPDIIVEQFIVASWAEHERQHARVSRRDQERLERVRAFADPSHPVTVTHWLVPRDTPSVTDAPERSP